MKPVEGAGVGVVATDGVAGSGDGAGAVLRPMLA